MVSYKHQSPEEGEGEGGGCTKLCVRQIVVARYDIPNILGGATSQIDSHTLAEMHAISALSV